MTPSSHNTTFYTMKRVAISLILFLLAHLGGNARAQVSGGPKVGINFPSHYVKETERTVRAKNLHLIGFHAGGELLVQLPVVGMEFELDALFTRKGYRYSMVLPDVVEKVEPDITATTAAQTSKITQELYYLEFPIKINYSLGLAGTGLFAGVGPTIGVGLFGWTRADREKSVAIGWGDGADEYKRYDFSLGAHLGVRVAGVQLSGYFDWGFVNISNRASVTRSNYNGGISLAYLFQ